MIATSQPNVSFEIVAIQSRCEERDTSWNVVVTGSEKGSSAHTCLSQFKRFLRYRDILSEPAGCQGAVLYRVTLYIRDGLGLFSHWSRKALLQSLWQSLPIIPDLNWNELQDGGHPFGLCQWCPRFMGWQCSYNIR